MSRSSRWTMPGRLGSSSYGSDGNRAMSQFTTVPVRFVAEGCVSTPAGLSMTRKASFSNTMRRGRSGSALRSSSFCWNRFLSKVIVSLPSTKALGFVGVLFNKIPPASMRRAISERLGVASVASKKIGHEARNASSRCGCASGGMRRVIMPLCYTEPILWSNFLLFPWVKQHRRSLQ